jgi:NaMN:DMB phosphoribosyltransferase
MGNDDKVTFRGRVRYWDPAKGGGLAVVDVPADVVERLGGRKQYRVAGTLGAEPFSGSGMLVAGGGYCVAVSQAALKAAKADIGDEVVVSIARA